MSKTTMRGLVGAGANTGRYTLSTDLPSPALSPGTLLVRVHAVALNPGDAKKADYSNVEDATTGHDFAGVVERVAPDVGDRFREGDRIMGVAYGMHSKDSLKGAFSDYVLATADVACRIPADLTFEEAAALSTALATAGLALFNELGLPLPGTLEPEVPEGTHVLVCGGATSTDTMAIQLLKRAGFAPLVTCSPANNTLCHSFGAVACFDYRSSTCGTDIRSYTNDKLVFVLDCASEASSMQICYDAIGSSGGKYVALEAFPTTLQYTRRDIVASWIIALSMSGEGVKLPGAHGRPLSVADREFSRGYFELVGGYLQNNTLTAHPVEVRSGGLGKVAEGIEEVKLGNVRAKKLVYPLLGEVF